MRNVNSQVVGLQRVAALAAVLLCASGYAAVGGQGPDINPSFSQSMGGGTAPVGIIFDPSSSYLPVSSDPAVSYLYQAIWDFGDGTGLVFVPTQPATAQEALAIVAHTFNGDAIHLVKLTLQITVQTSPGQFQSGPSAIATGQVHVAGVNYPPTPRLIHASSPATGTLPYELQLNTSTSFDEDGYVFWAAINWGDGTSELVNPLPPVIPNILLKHTYTAPGFYKVTLSLIDNGRMPLPSAISTFFGGAGFGSGFGGLTTTTTGTSTLPASDPNGALTLITQMQLIHPTLDQSFKTEQFFPQLKQDFLFVQVPGNMFVVKGQFQLDFRGTNNDKFDVLFVSNLFADNIANAPVGLAIGSGLTPLILPAFKTDARGKFKDSAQGLSFDFNAKKGIVRLKLTHAALLAAMGLTTGTVVNGNVDVPVAFVINGSLRLAATVRFVYNATAGDKGIGKNGRSFPAGD